MAKREQERLSRRDFIKWTGGGALAVGVASGPFFLFPEKAAAQQKTLKILQWSHFVPAYDTWFDGTFCKQWGQKHDTNVIVDHINLVDLSAKAASEALYPHLSVYKNIAFPLRAQNVKKELHKGKVEWAASLLGIGALLDRKPRELSGGERQRVALARAIVRERSLRAFA
jgi:ABC-type lipoprotein export system ATPase subunit